jgi:hypothetical protein
LVYEFFQAAKTNFFAIVAKPFHAPPLEAIGIVWPFSVWLRQAFARFATKDRPCSARK